MDKAAKVDRPLNERPELPRAIRKELATFASKLTRDHRALFASDPIYRNRAGQFLTALLPPKPRRPGRPGRADVTQAIKLKARFRRLYPSERPDQIWKRIYPLVVLGYEAMNDVEQKDARERLRDRVQWRHRAKWRYATKEIRQRPEIEH